MSRRTNKKGSAIALALVFATVLLTMGLAYSKMTQTSKTQTYQIDERIRLEYLAQGYCELALLKFQLYPADFYACQEAAKKGNNTFLLAFTTGAPEFSIDESSLAQNKKSWASFNDATIQVQLASMTILTNQKWNDEILYIEATANYNKLNAVPISKSVTRLVELERNPNRW